MKYMKQKDRIQLKQKKNSSKIKYKRVGTSVLIIMMTIN